MTVTISRLYDNHNDAQKAVRRLESAGVPHSDISIVANNSDSWFNADKKVDRDRDGVDDRAEGAGKAPALVRAPPGFVVSTSSTTQEYLHRGAASRLEWKVLGV